MANKLRIHVKFGGTKVLVPCGDGSILISDMVDKAIGKYKKANKLVSYCWKYFERNCVSSNLLH